MARKSKEQILESYDAYVTEIKQNLNYGRPVHYTTLCKNHGVNPMSAPFLRQLGYLIKDNGVDKFIDKGDTVENIVDKLLTMGKNYSKSHTIVKTQNQKVDAAVAGVTRTPLQNVINRVIGITKIANRYGVQEDKIEDFVKEIMEFKK